MSVLDSFASHARNFRQGQANTLPVYVANGVDYQNWRVTQHYDFTPLGPSENSMCGVLYARTEAAYHMSALIDVPAGPTITLTNKNGIWRLNMGIVSLSPRQALIKAIQGKLGLGLLSPDPARKDMIERLFRNGFEPDNIDEAIADAKIA